MHEKLGTGVSTDLEALSASLEELALEVDAGKDSHELIPRARARAVRRLQTEAGELALTRLEVQRGIVEARFAFDANVTEYRKTPTRPRLRQSAER